MTKLLFEQEFEGRLIIIDEVQNVRIGDDSAGDAKVAKRLLQLVSNVQVKLLLLSATPMFNTHKEIVWLLNLLNRNDKRATIYVRDIFNSDGTFKEGGREIIMAKSRGYISFVKGENPYTFPFRIYPKEFSKENTFPEVGEYPRYQINGVEITNPLSLLDIYVLKFPPESYQKKIYDLKIKNLKEKFSKLSLEEQERGIGHQVLSSAIQILNMVYPTFSKDLVDDIKSFGKRGMQEVMNFSKSNQNSMQKISYKPETINIFGKIFSPELLPNYSEKISTVCNKILNSKGIVLIYSQYIDSGIIPMSLALESIGFSRYTENTNKNLFQEPPCELVDSLTMLKESEFLEKYENKRRFKGACYSVISGNIDISPDNLNEIQALTKKENAEGENIKVVIISRAASEGMDLKNIRQVHILDPWYNMNRNEQIIGRAVRFRSHCDLPFIERNVEIFMYASYENNNIETADLYLYRLSESKALSIGRVARVLQENSADCILNYEQTNYNLERINQVVRQSLSSGLTINVEVGNKSFSPQCDYQNDCNYKCSPNEEITLKDTNMDSYNEAFLQLNSVKLIQKIKELFKIQYSYKKSDLIKSLNILRNYPLVQIEYALESLLKDRSEIILDFLNRPGNLVYYDGYYLFQPLDLLDTNLTMFERIHPLNYKRKALEIKVPKTLDDENLKEIGIMKSSILENNNVIADELLKKMKEDYELIFKYGKEGNNPRTWIGYIYQAMTRLSLNEDMPLNSFLPFILEHQIEILNFDECKSILIYLQEKENRDEYEEKIFSYFTSRIIKLGNKEAILLWFERLEGINYSSKVMAVVKEENSNWDNARFSDMRDLVKNINDLKIKYEDMAQVIGAIVEFTSKSKERVFKYVKTSSQASKGARCDQMGRTKCLDILKMINVNERENLDKILKEYSQKSRKLKKSMNETELTSGKINPSFLCAEIELYLRYYDSIGKDNKRWFFSPIEAIASQTPK